MVTVGPSLRRIFRPGVILLPGLFLFVLSTAVGCGGPQVKKAARPEQEGPIFYPLPPADPRIQYLTSFKTSDDVGEKPEKSSFASFVLGEETTKVEKVISKPFDMALHNDVIYITDINLSKVITIDLKQRRFDFFSSEGVGAIRNPVGIFIEPDGTKYIADMGRGQVLVFGLDNEYKMALDGGETRIRPTDAVVSGDRVFINDLNKDQILAFDKHSGKLLFTFGGKGEEEGKFFTPSDLAVDIQGNVYVADLFNFRIQKFDRDGKFLWSFGKAGDVTGHFARPKGLALDREGHIYVVDASFSNVQLFNQEGRILMVIGGPGATEGRMLLPTRVTINYDMVPYFKRYADPKFEVKHLVFVCNQFGNHPISVFGFGSMKE